MRAASANDSTTREAHPEACGATAERPARACEYRVVETSDVSDVELTRILNEMVSHGWLLDGIHFAMRDSSRRPAMAFAVFQRPRSGPVG
jgi:hypothetical protein